MKNTIKFIKYHKAPIFKEKHILLHLIFLYYTS